ncbi:MAG: hypothetical protein ABXS92_02785 [Sulfurimonas sp.]
MKQLLWIVMTALLCVGCTPSIGVSVPIGGNAYTGVSASAGESGVEPAVGVGVGVGL